MPFYGCLNPILHQTVQITEGGKIHLGKVCQINNNSLIIKYCNDKLYKSEKVKNLQFGD